MKKTKIITTLGPASWSEDTILGLYNAWANIIRFNFSHAEYENVARIKWIIDNLNNTWKTNLSVLLDTKWPEIRTWDLAEKIKFQAWDKIKIYIDKNKIADDKSLFCDYEYIVEDLNIWDIIEIDSGLLKTIVVWKTADYIEAEAKSDAIIWSRRHINLPWKSIKLPWITPKDEIDVKFAIENNFDFIAQSFVRTAENVLELREILDKNNASHIKIIAKIENEEGIENLEEIVKVADWVMVARWDLGIETPIEILPILQRKIIKKCLESGKFVILATQLLESMIENPFPTRAEVSDVFNWVMQKVDCLMLSGETAAGKYPVKTVETMTSVIKEWEKQYVYKHHDYLNDGLNSRDIEKKMLIKSAIFMADELNIDSILVFTKTWKLARLAAAYRPNKKVYSFTANKNTYKYLNILFGINPYLLENWTDHYKENVISSIELLLKNWELNRESRIIAITDIQKDGKEIPALEIITIWDFF